MVERGDVQDVHDGRRVADVDEPPVAERGAVPRGKARLPRRQRRARSRLRRRGALLGEALHLLARGRADDGGVRAAAFGLYVYLPNQAAPSTAASILLNKFTVGLSGSTEGLIQRVELPKTIAPTPQTGDTGLIRPIELGAAEALYLEKGYVLGVGYLGDSAVAVSGGLSPSGVSFWAQGGFY